MAYDGVDSRPILEIIHAMLRHDDEEAAMEQLPDVMDWVASRQPRLKKVTSSAEWEIIAEIYRYFDDHKTTPSRAAMDSLIHAHERCKSMLDVLADYDKQAGDFDVLRVGDLDVPLEQRVSDHEKFRLTRVLEVANTITLGSVPNDKDKDKKKPTLAGPRDAINFVISNFQKGILVNDKPVEGGYLSETVDNVLARYDAAKADRDAKRLYIPTGIPLFDNNVGGLRYKEMTGILGYTSQRKTWIARTIAYNAALSGFNVLHIPLESDRDEEENCYAVIHSSRFGGHTITKKKLEDGMLTKEEEALLKDVFLPAYHDAIATRIRVFDAGDTRSWADIKSIIERESFSQPIDLVVIDYLTMLSTPGARDDVTDKMGIVQDAKRLAMSINDGRGLAFVTPVQGNRKGYTAAGDNGGAWETTGIALYSEIDKSLDNCMYVWFDDALVYNDQIMMGSCKWRRAERGIPCSPVDIDPQSGLVGAKRSDFANMSAGHVTPPRQREKILMRQV